MSMLTLNGIVQNVFRKSGGIDKKTGEIIPASDHVQVMAENMLQNGEKRIELVTLKVETPDAIAPSGASCARSGRRFRLGDQRPVLRLKGQSALSGTPDAGGGAYRARPASGGSGRGLCT